MTQYVVVVVSLVSAMDEDSAIEAAGSSICEGGHGVWLCKELNGEEEPKR